VLVLNATFEPINVCTVRRAVVLLLKEKAEVLEHAEYVLRSGSNTVPRPVVIRLVTYVRVPRDTHRRKITRRAVFARDNWTCQYCGKAAENVDHVHPRSKGGTHTWDNVVAACRRCNSKKENRTPEDSGLKLARRPFIPSDGFRLSLGRLEPEWEPYL
jgi:5-methylcytosine-specific restriction endonuclease McrA